MSLARCTLMATLVLATAACARRESPNKGLAPIDTSCNTDDDCTITMRVPMGVGDGAIRCCEDYVRHAVNSRWMQSFRAACEQPGMADGCGLSITENDRIVDVKAACDNHVCTVVDVPLCVDEQLNELRRRLEEVRSKSNGEVGPATRAPVMGVP